MTRLAKATRLRVLAVVAALAVAGCSSNSGGSGDGAGAGEEGVCKAGREAAFANPAGTPFTLPTGVALDGELTGDIDASCPSKDVLEYGGDVILLCIRLKNTTTAAVDVTLPAGLAFIAKNPATMNGIILRSHVLKVPAGGVAHFYFRPFSLNRACGPGGTDDRYTFGNVVSDPRIREVVTLAATKPLDDDEVAYALGQMLWDITDEGGSITDEHRALLKQTKDL